VRSAFGEPSCSEMARLYDYAASANCFKIRLLLAQLGIEYERVPVDLFAGETLTDEYLARNPAGRTPVLELDSGECLAESNAILLYVAEGTPLLPDPGLERARVHQWLFFEQNLLEPNVGTARFWRLTGRDKSRREVYAQRLEAGRGAVQAVERHLAGQRFLVGGRYTVADLSLYAYTHIAPDVGIELGPATSAWLARVESQPGYLNDLAPYPPSAHATSAERSIHD
jgi:glutathione S-transferase